MCPSVSLSQPDPPGLVQSTSAWLHSPYSPVGEAIYDLTDNESFELIKKKTMETGDKQVHSPH